MKRILAALSLLALYCWWRGGHGRKRWIAGPLIGRTTCPECGKPQDLPPTERFLRGALRRGETDMGERFRRAQR